MDNDSSNHFISSLAKYLQNLCSGCVSFEKYVLVTGHLYVTVDTGDSQEYVVNEKLCKNNGSEVNMSSNSYHHCPKDNIDHLPINIYQGRENYTSDRSAIVFGDSISNSIKSKTSFRENMFPENISVTDMNLTDFKLELFPQKYSDKNSIKENENISRSDQMCSNNMEENVSPEIQEVNPVVIKQELASFSENEEGSL